MQITWNDAHQRGFAKEVYAVLPHYSCLSDELSEAVDTDDIEAGYSDNRFDYEYGSIRGTAGGFDLECDGGEGEVTVEFDDIEAIDPECDECPVDIEIEFDIHIEVPVPISRSESRRIAAHGECDYPTESVSVACKATRLSYTVEERTVEFRGEPLTYFHYKATYKWETTGGIEA